MKKYIISLCAVLLLTACNKAEFSPINPHEQFVASVNIVEPSVQFFSNKCEPIATWQFDEPYTGGTLMQFDQLFLYGNQMTEAHIYEISTGRKLKTIKMPVGTTNAYFDVESERLFVTNGKTNTLTMYDIHGSEQGSLELRNYPMSMTSLDGKLYVVNFKDTVLSVVDIEVFRVIDEWTIPQDSHGLLVDANKGELWIGGHGVGATPNPKVSVFQLETGEIKEKLDLPMMPVGLAKQENGERVAVVSHGNSTLYMLDGKKEIDKVMQIGANPFAVTFFEESIVVAGYDDDTLYFVEDGQVSKQCETLDGPFQLIVRGA